MPTRRQRRRVQFLAAPAANSGARRGPPARARRAPQGRNQQFADKSAGQIVRARNPIPRGLSPNHHFNAFGTQIPQALAFSVGPATQVSGAYRFPLALQPADTLTLLAFQPGSGAHQALIVKSDGTGPSGWSPVSAPSITSTGIDTVTGPSASSPDKIMCSRGSLRIRNLTPAGEVAGAVHILRVSTGMPSFYADPAEAPTIGEMILQHKDTVTMSGSSLTETHQWDCIPVSQDKYHEFVSPYPATSALNDPGLSTILVLFEHPNPMQHYELSMAATYYARYRHSGPLANASAPPPVAPLPMINRVRGIAEAIGSMGTPLLQKGMAMARREIERAVPGMLGNLVRQNAGFPALANARLLPIAL